jgi:DNA-binding NtrC family response regulator
MTHNMIPPAAQRPRGNTIVIVEDDADIGFFLQQMIEEETPYQTIVLTNGLQAPARMLRQNESEEQARSKPKEEVIGVYLIVAESDTIQREGR